MPLLDLWKATPSAVEQLSIEQVVATAGDGRLLDKSTCSSELRSFLKEIPSESLAKHLQFCLSESFQRSGFVLQDIVNELGRRLDFEVENGLYQGSSKKIGYDGLWTAPEGNQLIVEVKTTDAYRISLDTLIAYKTKLRQAGRIGDDATILIVVGRQDTGDLEAQVRGSRYAWDVRLISADALFNLVTLKESTEEPITLRKMRGLLIPVEYTRVDQLIDVLFTAAKDVEAAVETEQSEPVEDGGQAKRQVDLTDAAVLQAKRHAMVEALERHNGVKLIKKSRATYWHSSRSVRAVCTISKRYADQAHTAPY